MEKNLPIKNDKYSIDFGDQGYSWCYFGDSIHKMKYYPKTNKIVIWYNPEEEIMLYSPVKYIVEACKEAGMSLDDVPEIIFKVQKWKCPSCEEMHVEFTDNFYKDADDPLRRVCIGCKEAFDKAKEEENRLWKEFWEKQEKQKKQGVEG